MENKRIGAWKKQTAKGEVISFSIDGKRYSMWPNQYKKEDKHPDFNIVEDKPFERTESKPIKAVPVANNIETELSDELPF